MDEARTADGIPPLAHETRTAVDTRTAAHHLSRSPKTLRSWSSAGSGPIRPHRINGRLSWQVADLRRLLDVEVTE
jgi:hypothetical protein